MIQYMNVGYEYDHFGVLSEETNMPRIFIYKDNSQHLRYNSYQLSDQNIIFNNKYALKIWMNLNGYKIYRAYIYAKSIINNSMVCSYDNLKCQLFLCRK